MTELSIQHTSRAMIMIYQRSIISGLLSNCLTGLVGSQFDEGLRHQWPLHSTEIWIWHITAQLLDRTSVPTLKNEKPQTGHWKNPRKPQVKFLCNWLTFWEKIQLFLERKQLFRKKSVLYPPKFLMTFFSYHYL